MRGVRTRALCQPCQLKGQALSSIVHVVLSPHGLERKVIVCYSPLVVPLLVLAGTPDNDGEGIRDCFRSWAEAHRTIRAKGVRIRMQARSRCVDDGAVDCCSRRRGAQHCLFRRVIHFENVSLPCEICHTERRI